ncbi:MAG: 2-oxoacid:ferredoxin oxidoreductase subunit beta [Candidatus Adiutrix sp.]
MTEFQKSAQAPAWCPGCGNFHIREALINALNLSGLKKHETVIVSGIGQSAKMPHYIDVNFFNGLHGRSLPAATGLKLANPNLTVVVESGEGCHYGEGGNHFLATLRRNLDITVLVNDNQIYGLTKGQASPTTDHGQITKSQPQGVMNQAFHPLSTAIINGAGFVARGFSGDRDFLAQLILEAIRYPGLSLVDILMPCVSFNQVNTFAWYKAKTKKLTDDHDPSNKEKTLKIAEKWGDEIPVGIIYRRDPQMHPPLNNLIAEKRGLKNPLVLVDNPPNISSLTTIAESLS